VPASFVEEDLMEEPRTSFYVYLENGEYSTEFISDIDSMINVVYRRWSLYDTLDEFRGFCWTKIVNSLRIYDNGGRETGPLSTYLYQVVMNEARRLYSKFKKFSLRDATEVLDQGFSPSHADGNSDLDLRDNICAFARRAYSMGVFVDQIALYLNYVSGRNSPAVKAFKWCSVLSS
jgi:hypothetical protein